MSITRVTPLGGAAALLLVAACEKPPEDDVVTSSDVRIDAAPQGSDPDSLGPRMCMNDDGFVYVIWVDNRDGQDDIWFNRSSGLGALGTWLPAAVKVNKGDSNIWNPAITCTTQGVFVAWEDDRDGDLQNHQIYFSLSLDSGETWSEDTLLELDLDGESMSLGPDLAAVGTDVYVAWFDNVNGAYDIMFAHSDNNGVDWDNPVRVDSDDPAGTAYSAWPQIQATENGFVYITWEDSRNGASDIYFARSENAGATFKEDSRLDGGDDAGLYASFEPTMDSDGNNIYVVWHDERGGSDRDIYLNYSGNGGADWRNSAERVDTSNEGFFNSLFPVVATDGAIGHVAWQDEQELAYGIYYRQFNGGDALAPEIRIDTGKEAGLFNSVNPKISFDSGNMVVAWEDARGAAGATDGYNDLYYNYSTGDGNFEAGDFRIDSMPAGQSFKVELDTKLHLDRLSGNQYVCSVWMDGRLGTTDIFFSTLVLGNAAVFEDPEADGGGGGGE